MALGKAVFICDANNERGEPRKQALVFELTQNPVLARVLAEILDFMPPSHSDEQPPDPL